MQTDLGTESIRSLVTKRSNGFGYTNLGHSRSHKIEKNKTKNGFDPFSYKFFVPIRVGLTPPRTTQKNGQFMFYRHIFKTPTRDVRYRSGTVSHSRIKHLYERLLVQALRGVIRFYYTVLRVLLQKMYHSINSNRSWCFPRGGWKGVCCQAFFILFSFPCSADHEREWPQCTCKVVVFSGWQSIR